MRDHSAFNHSPIVLLCFSFKRPASPHFSYGGMGRQRTPPHLQRIVGSRRWTGSEFLQAMPASTPTRKSIKAQGYQVRSLAVGSRFGRLGRLGLVVLLCFPSTRELRGEAANPGNAMCSFLKRSLSPRPSRLCRRHEQKETLTLLHAWAPDSAQI